MNNLIYSLGFNRTGKPRQWLNLLLFRKDQSVRPIFRRIVHKKNGRVRPRYAHWIKGAQTAHVAQITSTDVAAYSQEELFLQSLLPLEDVVTKRRGRKIPSNLLTADAIQAQIMSGPGRSAGRMLVSVGHENYREVQGGVELCTQREEVLAYARGYDEIFPKVGDGRHQAAI